MAINVPVSSILHPQHMFVPYFKPGRDSTSTVSQGYRELLVIYTGMIEVGPFFGGGTVGRETVTSFVPYSDSTLQDYSGVTANWDQQIGVDAQLVATSSLAAWRVVPDNDALESVEDATAYFNEQTQPELATNLGAPYILLLSVPIGALHGQLHRVTYQVTVRLTPKLTDDGIPTPDGLKVLDAVEDLETAIDPDGALPQP
jgi:hypothetical protein